MRLPLPAVILLFVVSIIVDIYIWLDIRHGKSRKRWAISTVYALSSIILWIFLIVTVSLPRRGLDGGVYTVMWMLTAYFSIYVPKILYCIFSLLGMIPCIFKAKRWRWTKYVGLTVSIAGFAAIWWGIIYTRTHSMTIFLTTESDRLPSSFDGYRIAQISDLHLGTWGKDTEFIDNLVDSINALNPDLIVFTGDAVNQKSEEMLPFIPSLSRLKARDGVYSVLGNHDYGDYVDWPSEEAKKENLDNLKKYQSQAGWKLLNNDHTYIYRQNGQRRDSIALIGVENWGEPPFPAYGDLNEAYPVDRAHNLRDHNFKILLTHNPEHWVREVRNRSNIDLSLSGHTHAMQMSLNALGRRWSPSALRYNTWGGFYTNNKHGDIEDFGNPADISGSERSLERPSLYVNIGAGEVAMPYRIGTSYPEITLITLKRR